VERAGTENKVTAEELQEIRKKEKEEDNGYTTA